MSPSQTQFAAPLALTQTQQAQQGIVGGVHQQQSYQQLYQQQPLNHHHQQQQQQQQQQPLYQQQQQQQPLYQQQYQFSSYSSSSSKSNLQGILQPPQSQPHLQSQHPPQQQYLQSHPQKFANNSPHNR
jgi:hypothetical protein